MKLLKTLPMAVVMAMALSACNKPADTATDTTATTPDTATTQAPSADKSAESAPVATAPIDTNLLTIYSTRNEQLIKPVLDKFSAETGIKYNLVTDKPGPLMERIKAEGANSPADVLVAVDAGTFWKASQDNLLQPALKGLAIDANIPAQYRDKDGRWTALALRARTIFHSSSIDPATLSTYEDLADPKWKGKLCLRTSNAVYNKSLVASLIERLGEQKTREVIKGWVANLATEPFENDTKMLEAIASGQCGVGIANSYYYGRLVSEKPEIGEQVKPFWANQATSGVHMNVSGAGILTTAKHIDEAKKLIEWLSDAKQQGEYSSSNFEFPANPKGETSELLKSWGTFKTDTMDTAKYGERQAEAVKLMDELGYK